MHIYQKSTRLFAAAVCSALLVACGGGDAKDSEASPDTEVSDVEPAATEPVKVDVAPSTQVLIDGCMEEGGTEQLCGCSIQALEDAIGAEELATVAELAEDDADAANLYVEEIMGSKLEVATKMSASMQECLGG